MQRTSSATEATACRSAWHLAKPTAGAIRSDWRGSQRNCATATGNSFAKLQARPIVAGIGYGWHFGKFSTGAQLQAGWSFNSAKPIGDIAEAFLLPSNSVSVHIGNSFVARPQLKVEYFLTSKFTLRTALNYIFTNPMVTVTRPDGIDKHRWNASNVTLSMGIGVYPFRK